MRQRWNKKNWSDFKRNLVEKERAKRRTKQARLDELFGTSLIRKSQKAMIGFYLRFMALPTKYKTFGLAQGLLFIAIAMHTCYVGAVYLILTHPPNKQERRERFYAAVNYHSAIAIRDADGNLLGNLRSEKKPPYAYLDTSRAASIPVREQIPEHYKGYLSLREDRYLTFDDVTFLDLLLHRKRSYMGIDIWSPLIGAIQGRGGSTLSQQLVKAVSGDYKARLDQAGVLLPGRAGRWQAKLYRKMDEVLTSAAIFPDLVGDDRSGDEFWALVAAQMPYTQGSGGLGYGLIDSAALVYGKKLKELTELEIVILTAATYRQIQFVDRPITKNETPTERWEKILDKARYALEVKYAASDPARYRELLAELERSFAFPPKTSELPMALADVLPEEEIRSSRSLTYRTHLFSSMRLALEEELGDLVKEQGLLGVRLEAMRLDEQYRFKAAISKGFQTASNNNALTHKLSPDKGDHRPEANVRVRLSRLSGIRRGVVGEYRTSGSSDEVYPLASLTKAMASLLLVRAGFSIDTPVCNKMYQGLGNASGTYRKGHKRCQKRAMLPLGLVLAKSLNLPFRDALERADVHENELRALYSNASLDVVGGTSLEDATRSQLIDGLAFGSATTTVRDAHQAMSEIVTTMIYGNCETTRLTGKVQIATPGKTPQGVSWAEHPSPCTLEHTLKSSLQSSKARADLRDLLTAPVNSPGGTLVFARELGAKYGVDVIAGKTGSANTSKGNTRAKYISLAFVARGELHMATLFVGATNNQGGLGKNIKSRNLYTPVLEQLFSHVTTPR